MKLTQKKKIEILDWWDHRSANYQFEVIAEAYKKALELKNKADIRINKDQ